MNVAAHPAGHLEFATTSTRSSLSRQAKAGKAIRLAAGVYAVGATIPAPDVARYHRLAIIGHTWPGAVLCARTALTGGVPAAGEMFVAVADEGRAAPLRLPGLTVFAEVGPAPLPGDMALVSGLSVSGRARQLVENVHLQGRPARSKAGTTVVEERIDELARRGGPGAVRATLAELDVVAGAFDARAVGVVRDRLVAVLGTGGISVASARLRARLQGVPFDAYRVERLTGLAAFLRDLPPEPRPTTEPAERSEWLPFFESYFSNFIEGTEFGVDEARRIAVDGDVPADRPADAHDVVATYRLAAESVHRALRARSGDQLIEMLAERHAVLMAARIEKRPGRYKDQPNYAGGYQFVEPDLVDGTLRRGFDVLAVLTDPFARSVGMMALITECHPFDDGNGRLARLMANAELTSAGETRIVIPTVYRNNYLVALTAFSNGNGIGEALASVLRFAQRWVSVIDWSTYAGAKEQLEACNAFVDPGVADATGQQLRLPS